MKGQVNFLNILAIFGALILFMFLLYVLTPAISDTVVYMNANANSTTPAFVVLIELTPFFILAAIIVTIWIYAIPRREG